MKRGIRGNREEWDRGGDCGEGDKEGAIGKRLGCYTLGQI